MDLKEKIEAYYAGDLSEEEIREVEEAVQSDPELKKEFEFQGDINEAIRQVRVSELKAHLDTVNITPSLFDQTLFKVLGSAAVITTASIVGYFLLKSEPEVTPTVEEPHIERSADSVAKMIPQQEQLPEKPDTDAEESSPQSESRTPVTPKPVTPDVIEEFADEETREEIDIPENEILENTPPAGGAIGIEIKSGTQYDFHYKFLEDRLFLYGDFSDDIYDILEIKTDSMSQLYFSFKDKFYQLNRDRTEITPLTEITNQELIEKLRAIKQE